MDRSSKTLSLATPSLIPLLSILGCAPLGEPAAPPAVASSPSPVLAAGGYAAMDEVPAEGGELRLQTPIEVEVELEIEARGPGPIEIKTGTPATETRQAIGFPLKHTDVDVDVSGMIAHYTVTQEFENPFDDPLEAVYVFPLGAKAAVVDYEIIIGERVVKGTVETREKARAVYEQAKATGRTAALLEQEKPNVFTQHIANIAPREQIAVRFRYIEMLGYRDNTYELVYPMVVGPRYLPQNGGRRPIASHRAGDEPVPGATSIAYVPTELVANAVSFRARIDAGVPIVNTNSPSHDLAIVAPSETTRDVTLGQGGSIPNRDLVLRYSAAGRRTMIGALNHRADDEQDGYFTLVIQPKADYRTGDIRAREVIILIDKSGSMQGAPLAQARALSKAIVGTLGGRDVFNVVTFASGTESMALSPVAGTAASKAAAVSWIEQVDSGGGTEMESAVLRSLATDPGNDRVRMVYVLSDGFVGNDDVILDAARKHLGHNRVYPIGIGSAPNRYLFDRLGDVGRGFTSYLLPSEDASKLANDLVRRSAYPYLTDLAIDWSGLDVRDLTPAKLPDVHAGTPIAVSGRYATPGSATIKLKARGAGRMIEIPLAVSLAHNTNRPAVRYLWARNRVEELMGRDYGETSAETERAVTEIGLGFQMVTAFTSFVAVDRQNIVEGGIPRTVVQPAAIPEGVNIVSAVGGQPPSNPSPAPRARQSRSGGGGGGGGGWGGGDTDPFTLLYLLLLMPSIVILRRFRTT